MSYFFTFAIVVAIILFALVVFRALEAYQQNRIWNKIKSFGPTTGTIFTADRLTGLDEPIRRYFTFMIDEGTVLTSSVRITMNGQMGLGPKSAPDYMDMRAEQILSFPIGFIWNVKSGRSFLTFSGSDGFYKTRSWSRFWLLHLLPVGRAGGRSKHSHDHRRAAFGRLVAEASFWSPASLLPSENVMWSTLDETHIQARVEYDNLIQIIDVFLKDNGQPSHVIIPRWSDANPRNIYQEQPFGGYLSDFKNFQGYNLPCHVEGGNFIGTEDYFPFFIANVSAVNIKP